MQELNEPLFDRFGRKHTYLRVSLTDRCNLRCTYCMPEEGVELQPKANLLSFEEIETLVQLLVRQGVNKVRLTGGEPTVRRGYLQLIEQLTKIEGLREIAITTNGCCLQQDARRLYELGVKVNVSLDTLRRERFKQITRRDLFEQVWAGIHHALEVGIQLKINCVVLPGQNEDEIVDFAELPRHLPVTMRFIEFMPFLENNWSLSRVMSSQDIRDLIATVTPLEPVETPAGEVATKFSAPGFRGDFEFVSSVTESFCDSCNRLRLTADGMLKSCLFLPASISIRDLLRKGASESELLQAVQTCLEGKWREHPPMARWQQLDRLAMVQIGG